MLPVLSQHLLTKTQTNEDKILIYLKCLNLIKHSLSTQTILWFYEIWTDVVCYWSTFSSVGFNASPHSQSANKYLIPTTVLFLSGLLSFTWPRDLILKSQTLSHVSFCCCYCFGLVCLLFLFLFVCFGGSRAISTKQ